MSCLKLSPHILLELPDITESIKSPIRNVQRIKYTSFDVSKSLIAFGATSGGIYIFNRHPCEFIQLIPNKDGAITRLAISTDERYIAFANGRGIVTVTACDQSLGTHSPISSKEHQGNEVTAMAWDINNMLFAGDDVGRVSVLQMQSFIAKTMFQSSSQIIMCLDSRICQIDVKSCMLLVSTFTRCYICDTRQEQYRQIGQKLRDGEFGACFVNKEQHTDSNAVNNTRQEPTEVKTYNIVNEESSFAIGKGLENTLIYCARPSSRLWEATIDGTVKRTHQFKQILGRKALPIVSQEGYQTQKVSLKNPSNEEDGRAVNFLKIYTVNSAIFSFKKDALYFLNVDDVDDTIWFDKYNDIIDCKVYHDMVYVWLSDGSLVSLKFMKIDKFLVMCYVDDKFRLCAEMSAFFSEYLLSSDLSPKLHILVGLKDKISDSELLSKINNLLDKFEHLKLNDAIQMKSGIYVMDNTYNAQTSLLDDKSDFARLTEDYKFTSLPPEAIQTLKDLSVTVTDKLNTSKKILKEKWGDLEEKVKHLSIEKQYVQEVPLLHKISTEDNSIIEHTPVSVDDNIVFKESSHKAIAVDHNGLEQLKLCKSLYQYFSLSLVSNEDNESNLISIIESNACDISQIYNLMLELEKYCIIIGASEESKFVPNYLFLNYLKNSSQKCSYMDLITKDEALYKYFVDSCISVNIKTQRLSNIGCECGFPLPYTRTNQTPVFFELIDEFIERQWSSQTRDQCYDICKRMPYLWRKILYLRRNEDLMNILRLVLQILDENLLHSFLPQFTLDTWNRAVQLYATLHANICLNCSKTFDNISVKEMLSWDDMGALMIKSIGGRKAIKVMEKHASLIEPGALTVKFYHTCLLVTMYEKYDVTIVSQLTDAIYTSFCFKDSREELCKLLRNSLNGEVKNTALPLLVAAKSNHWGLNAMMATDTSDTKRGNIIEDETMQENIIKKLGQSAEDAITQEILIKMREEITDNKNVTEKLKYNTFEDVLQSLGDVTNGFVDCLLCGLPLKNEVLIKDGGLWVFKCGHVFHGACLDLNKVKLCPSCSHIIK
ncbi:hypothetical protein K1T71_011783 [Dendrolimus kikuchii]|uniref:Uncharacterized protein n=1 Tax=Dendrolimus kikuchii TaxID=765133 RepID=A0ACC1CMP9_9NEOP|nr:hypothetical protein K1T71_011783 [Dendrolimus kikuchii]